MSKDFGTILLWWVYIFGIGIVFFPLTKKIFHNFFDKGYLFSKTIGILFSSYLVWLLASLKILPFYKESIWLVLVIGLLINLLISTHKPRSPSKTPLSPNPYHLPPIIILEELMFLGTLIFWSYIRGFQPDIQGLEKFMDFGFVNSILRSKFFPPQDMWFAGKSINYYYFGHYITAFLTRLTGINSAITYNLMIATLFAFCFSLTFSLTANLVYWWKKISLQLSPKTYHLSPMITAGLIAALLVSLGANLHPSFYNIKMKIFKKPYCDGALTYWYPNATRYIGYCPDVEDKTIHEFPSYSFIVSDLHGHVSDIPFVLTFLALCLTLFIKIKEEKEINVFSIFKSHFLIPGLLAIMFMTNQWDVPIYVMVLGFTLFWGYYQNFGFKWKTIAYSLLTGLLLVIPVIPLILPFQFGFDPIAKGIDFVHAHSLFYQLLILWGVPWFFGLAFLVFLFGKKIKPKQIFKKENLVKWFSKILGVQIEIKKENSSLQVTSYKLIPTDIFVLILFLVSTLLIIIPEIIYVKDIYISSYHRANTIFKLTYQSFIMFSISIAYVFVRIKSSLKKCFSSSILTFAFCILIFALLVYPNYSIPGYYGKLEAKNYKGLYGLNFLDRLYPDDYKLITWLNEKIVGQPVVLEAVGDSYTDYERISMATGLPTIEGWLVHEWLWRGSYDEPGKRSSEVQTIYESKDVSQTTELLKTYNVKYIVVGEMEKTKYPNLNEGKIKQIGKKVFESNKTALYEII